MCTHGTRMRIHMLLYVSVWLSSPSSGGGPTGDRPVGVSSVPAPPRPPLGARFMLPTSDFQEAGEARVQLSLNGQQFDAGEPLSFQYHHAVQCTLM